MASLSRSAAVNGARAILRSSSSKAPLLSLPTPSCSAPRVSGRIFRRIASCVSRLPTGLACIESLMPLHSTIASARLKSFISIDSACWAWLSQGLAMPR